MTYELETKMEILCSSASRYSFLAWSISSLRNPLSLVRILRSSELNYIQHCIVSLIDSPDLKRIDRLSIVHILFLPSLDLHPSALVEEGVCSRKGGNVG